MLCFAVGGALCTHLHKCPLPPFCSITMDSQEVAEVPLLAPYVAQLESVIRQLVECMRAFSGMVQELVEVDRCVCGGGLKY